MLCAHINSKTFEEQSVKEHLYNVSNMAKNYGAKIELEATAELTGILHDMGKGTKKFDAYIHYSAMHPQDKSLKGTINHSTAGAKFIYDNFYNVADADPYQRFTAQLIALAICSHHGGLIDCLDLGGTDKFTDRMNPDKDILYDEAVVSFERDCVQMDCIKDLFQKSKEEIKVVLTNINRIDDSAGFGKFAAGMLEKYLFSCIIDADRYDTYTFMEGKKQKSEIEKITLWMELSETLENKLKDYPKISSMDLLRDEVSTSCKSFGSNPPGIYQLAVPTGGGKTLSSLRYALEHAKGSIKNGTPDCKDRIFYVIPYTTIIDQNAREIKDILGHEELILEHHSNLVFDHGDNDENEDVQTAYKLLTERWDSPIILTTMVQFLDTLFSGGTQNVRRMHNLANSIIIFDEIQAIPIKCINMFNSAVNFLANICNATVILCTATQPLLEKTERPLNLSENPNITANMREKFEQLKRVELLDKRICGGYTATALKDFVVAVMDPAKSDNAAESVLVILNTKNAAKEVFNELQRENADLPVEKQTLIFHLSTNMCPAHRMEILADMRARLGHQRIICISTQLIEAGVNISFECVIRSLAGLDSIAQAAGRCNRHGEKERQNVYIVDVSEENVSRLADIKTGQDCTRRVLDDFKDNPASFGNDLLSIETMERYYQYYFHEQKRLMDYSLSKELGNKAMYEILAGNREADNAFKGRNGNKSKLMLKQAFKTAGNEFQVIDQNTTGVIVPYGEGKELISLINGNCSLSELKQYLKKAQQFSVNLFETDKRKLEEKAAIVALKDNLILVLRDGFYSDEIGVTVEGASMEFYNC